MDEYIKMFKSVYSDNNIYANLIKTIQNTGFIEAEFPDGTFYFLVEHNTVSSAYKSLQDAEKVLKKRREIS